MSRAVLNLVLLVIIAGLGIGIWLSQEKEDKGPPLTALARDSIQSIEVAHPGKDAIRLEKQDGEWFLTAPVQATADKFEVNGILALVDLELQTRFDEAVELEALELSPPVYTVTLDQTEIRIGGKEPIQHRRYVAVGDTVGLVSDPPSAALDADYSDLVSREIVPSGAELVRITLPDFSLSRDDEGNWSSPERPDASTRQLAKLAQGWADARAMWNAAAPESASTGDALELELASGEVIRLRVHERDPQLVLAREDLKVHYTLSKALVAELLSLPEEGVSDPAPDTESDSQEDS